MKYLESRKYVIQIIFLVVGITFAIKLFFIQVFNSSYKTAAENNAIQKIIQYPFRGLIYDRDGKLLVQNTPVYDLMVVPKEVKLTDTLRFANLLGVEMEDFRARLMAAKKYSYVKPSAFLQKLSNKDLAGIQEHLVDFPGFYINARTARGYPHQNMAHALGYIAEISPQQLESGKYPGYRPGDYIGKSGIELEYEEYLMGKRGVKYMMVNVRGIEKGSFKDGQYDTLSVAGKNLISTIDLDLQQYGEFLMNGKKGSVVAIEPSTGEILSFISAPFYDPNLFTGKDFGKNYMALQGDTDKTLFNRPLMAVYPPGSIFKLVQAAIGLQEGIISVNTTLPCNKSLVGCHPHTSPLNLQGSIQHSCNPYYYQVVRAILNQNKSKNTFKDTEIGLREWDEHIYSFGFGEKLGIDLPNEKRGLVPSPNLYNKYYGEGRWKFSTIRSISIGQGEVGVTPLQMANLAAIIANRGYYYTPHLIKAIGENGKPLEEYSEKHYTTVDARHFTPIIEGMRAVVTSGTAAWANRGLNIEVCGKTGTAENPHGEDHAVYIAFAPKDNPKIAIAVYVENAGFGGMSAAPIASLMMERYLNDSVARKPLEDYVLRGKFIFK
ncbi:MAG: penicillin-binding protein 2 [Hymenobacteraceae bacterium]|nr:penicillin-binding protein 2 [Hymenobacteraceae bacterium]MDX5396676.1 penicillin-binding protein 2 [Hymenobacteraceae bacterium]MDX5444238.1 penicillin-binding protein 2 [Hymenobacteraceae bacterium]MDX5512739.1 penicillin-binding protein 2 [Hymenobacteraceae bacterium]